MPDKHVCPVDGCARSYGSFTSLQTHLILHHDQSIEDYAVKVKKRKSRPEPVADKAHRKEKKPKKKLRTERSATSAPDAHPSRTSAKADKLTKGPRVERAASVIDMRSPSPSPTPSPPSQPLERFSTAPLSPILSPLAKLHTHEAPASAKPPSTPSRVAMLPDSDNEAMTPTPSSAKCKSASVCAEPRTTPGGQAPSPKRPTWATRPASPPAQGRDSGATGVVDPAAAQSHEPRDTPKVANGTARAAAENASSEVLANEASAVIAEAPVHTKPVNALKTPRRALPSPPETPASPTIEQYICRNLPAALGTNAFAAFTGSRLLQDSAVIAPESANPANGPARDSSADKKASHSEPTTEATKSVLDIDFSKGATKVTALLRAIADLIEGTARTWTAETKPASEEPSG